MEFGTRLEREEETNADKEMDNVKSDGKELSDEDEMVVRIEEEYFPSGPIEYWKGLPIARLVGCCIMRVNNEKKDDIPSKRLEEVNRLLCSHHLDTF